MSKLEKKKRKEREAESPSLGSDPHSSLMSELYHSLK